MSTTVSTTRPAGRTTSRYVAPGDTLGTALDLLDRASATLLAACRAGGCADRYIAAHLGALRCAAALLAAHPHAIPRGGPVRTVWTQVPRVAPELTEWADYFALAGIRRAEVEGGATPSRREADDLLRAAEMFAALVRGALGLPVDAAAVGLPLAGITRP